MENEANTFVDGDVLIEVRYKVAENGQEGVDIKFMVDNMDIGTLIDLGAYFTALGRNQRIRTRAPEEEVSDQNSQDKKRVLKPSPKR